MMRFQRHEQQVLIETDKIVEEAWHRVSNFTGFTGSSRQPVIYKKHLMRQGKLGKRWMYNQQDKLNKSWMHNKETS